MTIYWILIPFLILLSALFSASETAYNLSNINHLKDKAEEGNLLDRMAYFILSHYDRMLTTILVGNNIANFGMTTCVTVITVTLLSEQNKLTSAETATTIATLITTVVLLICGEIFPKVYASAVGEKLAPVFAFPLRVFLFVLFPVVFVVNTVMDFVCRPFEKIGGDELTTEELENIIETGESEGAIDGGRSEMLQSAIGFSEKPVKELMIPRVDMYAANLLDDRTKLLQTIRQAPFSRIPVYEGSTDRIVGILNVNLFLKEVTRRGEDQVEILPLLKKPFYLQKSVKLPVALDQLRNERQHFAIIPDEYGGVMGIVTMEDILEELVGDIWDEHEQAENEIQQIAPDEYDVDADAGVSDFLETFLPDEEPDEYREVTSAGGWVLRLLERYPEKVGETFLYRNLEITVTEMEEHRLLRLHIKVLPVMEEADEETEAEN